MALFGLLGNKNKGYASPWLQLTVVYATARDGLDPEHAFVLRGHVISAHSLQFEFLKPGSFLVFFPGTAEGLSAGTLLADTMRNYAREKSVDAFGVGVLQGECLAQMRGPGRLAAKPAGQVITEAMKQAAIEAEADAQ